MKHSDSDSAACVQKMFCENDEANGVCSQLIQYSDYATDWMIEKLGIDFWHKQWI
jgi:hypothetical protein